MLIIRRGFWGVFLVKKNLEFENLKAPEFF